MGHREGKPYCVRHERELEWIMPFRTIAICRDKNDESDIGHLENVYGIWVEWRKADK